MPALSPAALRHRLTDGRLDRVHLFVGEDARLIDEMVTLVEATVEPGDRPFAVDRLYAGEPGAAPVDIAAAARSLPMLGDHRVVIVLRAERLLKPKRTTKGASSAEPESDSGPEPADCGALEDYLAAPLPSTTVVFVAADMDRTRRFTKRLAEHAQVTVFGGLASADAPRGAPAGVAAGDLVREMVEQAGRTMEPAAVQVLVERAGGNISKLRGDVDRLLLYTEGRSRISRADAVETAAGEIGVDSDWAVVNALAAGDAAAALREVGRRLDRGDSSHALVGQLRWWVSERLAGAAPARVPAALDALLRTDLALKSSGGETRTLVERLVAELAKKS